MAADQAPFYVGAEGVGAAVVTFPKPEPCPLPNLLVTAAVCSSKTSKQLYGGAFFGPLVQWVHLHPQGGEKNFFQA